MTVEREFEGTLQEFREKLETAMGSEAANFTQDDQRLIWQKPGDSARIEMKASNKRVYIIGKVHQIRSLTNAVAPFARCVGEAARSVAATSARTGSQRGPGSASGAPSQIYAPSAAYAPSAVYAPSNAHSVNSNSSRHSSSVVHQATQQRCVAVRAFQAESAGELELAVGDLVIITHDPADNKDQTNRHRWVFGKNPRTNSGGWFPLSHVTAQQESQAEDAARAESSEAGAPLGTDGA